MPGLGGPPAEAGHTRFRPSITTMTWVNGRRLRIETGMPVSVLYGRAITRACPKPPAEADETDRKIHSSPKIGDKVEGNGRSGGT